MPRSSWRMEGGHYLPAAPAIVVQTRSRLNFTLPWKTYRGLKGTLPVYDWNECGNMNTSLLLKHGKRLWTSCCTGHRCSYGTSGRATPYRRGAISHRETELIRDAITTSKGKEHTTTKLLINTSLPTWSFRLRPLRLVGIVCYFWSNIDQGLVQKPWRDHIRKKTLQDMLGLEAQGTQYILPLATICISMDRSGSI